MSNRVLVAIAVVLFVAGSFLLGRLWNENRALKNQTTTNAALPTPATTEQRPAVSVKPEELVQAIEPGTIPLPGDQDHMEGSTLAKVFLIEYSDLECPYCERFVETRLELLNRYPGQIAHIYRHFPLEAHRNAEYLAVTAECVAQSANTEEYFRFINTLYARNSSQGSFNPENTQLLIEEFGWAQSRINACREDGSGAARVAANKQDAAKAGVTGTPTIFLINAEGKGFKIVGAQDLNVFTYAVDQLVGGER